MCGPRQHLVFHYSSKTNNLEINCVIWWFSNFETRELNGRLFLQIVQVLNAFYEDIVVIKPMFSKILSGERWIILKNKKRIDY